MRKKDLRFLLAFAESRGIMSLTFEEVYHKACIYIDECCQYYDIMPDEEIDRFLETWEEIKPHTNLMYEVMEERHTDATLEQAMYEWDI